jgi:hypothetical protein
VSRMRGADWARMREGRRAELRRRRAYGEMRKGKCIAARSY